MLRILAKSLLKTPQFRLAATLSRIDKCSEDDMPDRPIYTLAQMNKSIKLHRTFRTVYSLKLKQKLNCSPEILPWVELDQLRETPMPFAIERLDYLCDIGASHDTVAKNITLLKKPIEQLVTGIETLMSLQPRSFNDLLPLLTLSKEEFDDTIARLRQDGVENNRIYCMSELLEIEPADMAKLYATYNKTLNQIYVARLKERIQKLLSYGITPDKLRCNLSVLPRSVERIEGRFTRIRQVYKGELKAWMVHCQDLTFDRHIKNRFQRQTLLKPNETIPEFLARKLKVEPIFVLGLLQKRPQLLAKDIKTLSDVLDFLLDECQFTAHQIISCPHIIFFNLATTKRRIAECRDLYNYMPTNLTVVAQSETKFRNHIAKMLHRRKCAEQAERSS